MLIDPQRRSRSVNRLVNPLLVKEMRTRRFGRSSWMLRLVFFCAIVSIAVTNGAMRTSVDRGLGPVGTILVALQVTLMVLLTPSLTAGLISARTRERGLAAAADDSDVGHADCQRQADERGADPAADTDGDAAWLCFHLGRGARERARGRASRRQPRLGGVVLPAGRRRCWQPVSAARRRRRPARTPYCWPSLEAHC